MRGEIIAFASQKSARFLLIFSVDIHSQCTKITERSG